MGRPLVSIVIPVYNSAHYLNQCVDSLINQSMNDVEYIFVDDGSTDNSVEILREYQKADIRVKILQQEHLYAGVARNYGIEEASGKYIMFLDSDDFFEPDMLRGTYNCAEKNNAQIVVFGYRRYNDSKGKYLGIKRNYHFPKGVFSPYDLGENLFSSCEAVPWNKLFLKEFVDTHHLRFKEVRKCNDTYFVQMALAWAERIIYLNRKYINYRIENPKSLQGEKNKDRIAYIDSGIAVKKGLIESGLYAGVIKASAMKHARNEIDYSMAYPYKKESLEELYQYTKQHLIPDLFEMVSDFYENHTAKNIYESTDFADFLCRELEEEKIDKKKNYMRTSCWTVRVGSMMLKIPKYILRL